MIGKKKKPPVWRERGLGKKSKPFVIQKCNV